MTSSHNQVMAAQYEAGARAAAQRIMIGKEATILEKARTSLKPYELRSGEPTMDRAERVVLNRCPIAHVFLACDALSVMQARLARVTKERDLATGQLSHRDDEAKADSRLIDESEAENKLIAREVSMLSTERDALCLLAGVLAGRCWQLHGMAQNLSLVAMALSLINYVVAIVAIVVSIHCLSRLVLLVPYIRPILDTIATVRDCMQNDSSSLPAHELSPPTPSLADKIRSFYADHCPDKLNDPTFVDRISSKYSYPGGAEALFASLNKRYD